MKTEGDKGKPPGICFFFSTTEFTGAAKMGYFFAKAFAGAGYEVTAFCGPAPAYEVPSVTGPLRTAGIRVVEEHGFESFFNVSLWRRIHRYFKERRPRAVVCMFNSDTKIAAWAARALGIPFFVSVQNRNTFFGRPLIRALKKHVYGFTLRFCATRIVSTSGAVQDQLVQDHGLPEALMCILPNGIDTAAYESGKLSPETLRASLALPPESVLLTNVGRIGEQKGQQVLVRAFAAVCQEHPEAHLLLVGEVATDLPGSLEYAETLHAQVTAHGLEKRVHFLGWRDDIADVLGASDLYVHSALWEGWALAPLEAMAGARPTIMTDCSGTPRGFADGVDGFIVPAGEAEPLAGAMRAALKLSGAERVEMGRRGRRIVEQNYDVKEIGRQFVGLIEAAA